MKLALLAYLRCPLCRQTLELVETGIVMEQMMEGQLRCTGCRQIFPVGNGIPTMLAPQMTGYAVEDA